MVYVLEKYVLIFFFFAKWRESHATVIFIFYASKFKNTKVIFLWYCSGFEPCHRFLKPWVEVTDDIHGDKPGREPPTTATNARERRASSSSATDCSRIQPPGAWQEHLGAPTAGRRPARLHSPATERRTATSAWSPVASSSACSWLLPITDDSTAARH